MSYEEALDVMVTRREARHEVLEHGLEWHDFIVDVGDLPEYSGEQVLAWLGY
jgi:hypothetical protein